MVIASAVSGVLSVVSITSDWVGVGVMIQFPDSQKPVYCLPMLKVSEVEVVHNWDTFGLRGSGSNQIIADRCICPNGPDFTFRSGRAYKKTTSRRI